MNWPGSWKKTKIADSSLRALAIPAPPKILLHLKQIISKLIPVTLYHNTKGR
jgi:hypothetical protein